jgi:hypothetical protein
MSGENPNAASVDTVTTIPNRWDQRWMRGPPTALLLGSLMSFVSARRTGRLRDFPFCEGARGLSNFPYYDISVVSPPVARLEQSSG